jgi:sugar fermentation stimulation protein A
MKLPSPLLKGRLVRRYKRFLADVELEDGGLVTAHCANPGSMMGLSDPGLEAWLSVSDNPKRKLKHSLELLRADGTLVGINTTYPNRLAEEAIAGGVIPALAGYDSLRREVKYGRNSRIDFLLEGGPDGRPCYVEVKNVHLRRTGDLAEFPDAVTARGAKHLAELAEMAENGARAVMLYVIQRADCGRFAVARDIDPAYDAALGDAMARGVEAMAWACRLSPEEIVIDRPVALTLNLGI